MSDDIELGLLGVTPSSSSSTLFDRSKVHSGYGARKIPIKFGSGAVAAGSSYQPIFEGHLGQAAAQGDPFGIKAQRSKDLETQRIYDEEVTTGNILRAEDIKPYNLNWNQQTRKDYPKHWAKVRKNLNHSTQKKLIIKPGLTLPFSKNIGPGNTIQRPLTRSDAIAAGHDLHYQYAKKDSDVLSADREAISHFAHEVVNPEHPISQIQAGIGFIGLGAKHAGEYLSGKVYYGKYVFTLS